MLAREQKNPDSVSLLYESSEWQAIAMRIIAENPLNRNKTKSIIESVDIKL